MTNLAATMRTARPPLDPLPREVAWLVWEAKCGRLNGQLETDEGTIADLQGYVLGWALCYLIDHDGEHALSCLQVASEAYRKRGVRRAEVPTEGDDDAKVWPIMPGAVFRPCLEEGCRTPITFVVTRIDEATGRPVRLPVTKDGRSHYLTCTNPKRFSGQSSGARNEARP